MVGLVHHASEIEFLCEVLEVLEDDLQLAISCQDQPDLRAESALQMHEVPRQFLVDSFQARIARLWRERKRPKFLPGNTPPHPRIESRLSHMLHITNMHHDPRNPRPQDSIEEDLMPSV